MASGGGSIRSKQVLSRLNDQKQVDEFINDTMTFVSSTPQGINFGKNVLAALSKGTANSAFTDDANNEYLVAMIGKQEVGDDHIHQFGNKTNVGCSAIGISNSQG